jgi:murein DD-endopeptidase MepM/ murein hydrolase activator NlpD
MTVFHTYQPRHRKPKPLHKRRFTAMVGTAVAAAYFTLPGSADAPAGSDIALASSGDVADVADALRDSRDPRASRSYRPMSTQPQVVFSKKPKPEKPEKPEPAGVVPVSNYRITGQFADVSGLWSSGSHTGLDFAAPSGTPIRAVQGGTVTQASYDGAYGYKTVVTLPSGAEVWYAHQSAVSVAVGQQVKTGQVIGNVGATGNVTGSHLHLEYRPNPDAPADPAAYLSSLGASI